MPKSIDINEGIVKKFVDSIRPEDPEIRKQIDIGYSYDGKAFILFEIRPAWDNPKEMLHNEFAKIRFYKSRNEWNLYDACQWKMGIVRTFSRIDTTG